MNNTKLLNNSDQWSRIIGMDIDEEFNCRISQFIIIVDLLYTIDIDNKNAIADSRNKNGCGDLWNECL